MWHISLGLEITAQPRKLFKIVKNSTQSSVDLLSFWFGKFFFKWKPKQSPTEWIPPCGCRGRCCSVNVASCCFQNGDLSSQLPVCIKRRLLLHVNASSPANCLSDVPRPPNLVTSFPLDWKMKTQQALLSTVMMCPFLSTATPLGPMSRPAPILFWKGAFYMKHFEIISKASLSLHVSS